MKKVRMLLRVSSNHQLEPDGDLKVQREIVKEYILAHEDWQLDEKEYFEGAQSGYRNHVKDRAILYDVLQDAKKHEFDILVVYKDDRIGRLMWEIGAYVMQLKSYGIDIYTTKDGCISPDRSDIMGQMMLALRYGNAQKSSADTGQRVKDTAQKLIKNGRFMGGKAPYGYKLELSGVLSKHGRALHKLVKIPEQAEVVAYIYNLSYQKELGSGKIAQILNADETYRKLAPNDVWKAGTVTSILTNPVYCGYVAYKRREKNNGRYHRLGQKDWIYADKENVELRIIEKEKWNQVQEKRERRRPCCRNGIPSGEKKTMLRNDGNLTLIDVIYCGYCGAKLTNGSRYNYWTIKATGEKRTSRALLYRCPSSLDGIPHEGKKRFQAEKIENIVFQYVGSYLAVLMDPDEIKVQILEQNQRKIRSVQMQIRQKEGEIQKIQDDIDTMKNHIPEAIRGTYPMEIGILADAIKDFEEKKETEREATDRLQEKLRELQRKQDEGDTFGDCMPTWQDVFFRADRQVKRVIIDKLVDKIIVTDEKLIIRFKFDPNLLNYNS
ncbi:MAG: recombinase family protein [Bariatricus sp.]